MTKQTYIRTSVKTLIVLIFLKYSCFASVTSLGLQEDLPTKPSPLSETASSVSTDHFPDSFDVRNIIKNPEVEFPVYHQGRSKSCSPHTVAAAIQ